MGFFDTSKSVEEALAEVELKALQGACLDDLFFLRELQQRKLYINGDIDHALAREVVGMILQWNKEDGELSVGVRKPIILYVTSYGGYVDAGYMIVDVILNSKTPVYTVNLGFQYSMGFLIGLAGHKRYATKHAKFLMHDGGGAIESSSYKMQDIMKFNMQVEDRTKEYVLSRSSITPEKYDEKARVEWYMFAEEAKENGFVDFIIGEDCTIDEVI